MNTFDIILGLLLVVGVMRGYSRGFFLEVTSLVGLGLGIYGAIHFSYFLGDYLKDRMDWDESMIQLVALAGTFLIILLALVFLGKALTKVADTIALGLFNKLMGAIFALFKYALILSVVLLVYDGISDAMKFVNKEEAKESVLYDPIKNLAPSIFPSIVKVERKTGK